MKRVLLIGTIFLLGACSYHSRQSQVDASQKEKELKQEKKLEEEKLKMQVALENKEKEEAKKEPTEVERVLAKKINPKTFEADMTVIEESNLYNELTCKSFRYSYELIKNSGQSHWDITYKKALDGAKQGSESARRIENSGSYSKN